MEPGRVQADSMNRRRVAAVLLAVVLAFHGWAVLVRAGREPHMDENEYMHAGWMMANGGRLYATFFEHHSPFFFKALEVIAPEGERADVRPYFIHARWLCGAFGLVALIALAALLWHVAPEAAAIGVGLLLATGPLWLRGFGEVRAEPFALAFFWGGTFIAMRWRTWIGGIGIGLVAISCIWMPKWPVACAAVGLLWLFLCTQKVKSIAAAIATLLLGFGALRLIVPLDVWWFFNFDVNQVLAAQVDASQWALDAYFGGGIPFLHVPAAFHPRFVVPAVLLVLAAFFVEGRGGVARSSSEEQRAPAEELRGTPRNSEELHLWRLLPVLVLGAAFIEIRILYPWPAIWSHYYLMWGIAAAGVLALVPSSIEILLRRANVREKLARLTSIGIHAAAFLLLFAHLAALAPVSGDGATYFVSTNWFLRNLRPGERVWIEAPRHPITVRDAHYYWFSVGQMASGAEQLRRTERGRRYLPPPDNFPVCDPDRVKLRFTMQPSESLRGATACMEQLVARGQAVRTVFGDVWELRLKSAADPDR
jgi:hypothetical protein